MSIEPIRGAVYNQLHEIAYLESIRQLLGWDRQVNMPPSASNWRAEQSAYVGSQIHKLKTSEQFFEDLNNLHAKESSVEEQRVIGRVIEQIARVRKIPMELVAEIARFGARAERAWHEAKLKDDFSIVVDELRAVVRVKQEYAKSIADDGDLYLALAHDFEPHLSREFLEYILNETGDKLRSLVGKLPECREGKKNLATLKITTEALNQLCSRIGNAFGFDWSAGAMSRSAHPFCSNHGPGDIRITTFEGTRGWIDAVTAIVHELGHALYEQGVAKNSYAFPQGKACSLGVHESQSFIWERHVGQTEAFWDFCTKELASMGAPKIDAREITRYLNSAQRSLIRIEADELTYGLHIVIRARLEKQIVSGELDVSDLPEAWNAAYLEFLGIKPSSDRQGVLQDIHWYNGMIGYFPTYLIGAIYAAQLYGSFTNGDYRELQVDEYPSMRLWLEDKIYQHGQLYKAEALIEKAVGSPPSSEAYLNYLQQKYLT